MDAPARGRVLATDDRPDILRLIDRTLGDRYECHFAGSVGEARAALAAADFDLALCDIEMPGESGLVLAEEIVAEHPTTAVVLVTGEDSPAIAEQAFDFGAHGYLVKPFWPGQLLIAAMNAVRRCHLELAQEARSRTLEQRMQLLVERAPVPIFSKDRDRRYRIANRAMHEIMEVPPGGMIGRRAEDLLDLEEAADASAADARVLERGETFEEEEVLLAGEARRTFLTVKFPIRDETDEITGIFGIAADLTAKGEAERLREELNEAQRRAIEELRASRQETVDRLSKAIERHDAGTGEHVNRMATVAALLGERCGLERERVLLLRAAAPMHDVGKVATPDAILRKAGPLTAAERTEMERHTTAGHEILAGSTGDLLQLAATIALSHHERWDGDGYPQGLRSEEIPLEARIVAVADVFDALLSDRSYRPAMPLEEAIAIIREGRGTHFDPALVDLLLDNLDEAVSLRG